MSQEDITRVLQALLTSNNAVRSEAERYFTLQIESNQNQVVCSLINILGSQNEVL
jgi:hypothetical protein